MHWSLADYDRQKDLLYPSFTVTEEHFLASNMIAELLYSFYRVACAACHYIEDLTND